MGNDAACSRLCQKGTVIQHNPDDILNTEYIVPCQICNSQFKHLVLKQHIDIDHYGAIKQENNGCVVIECILCNKITADLTQHGKHIQEKHPYAVFNNNNRNKLGSDVLTQNVKENKAVEEWQLNNSKKATAVRLQRERDFQIIKQLGDNRFEASVYSLPYQVTTISKDYRGADYDKELVQAELIWFNIFKQKRKVRYYYVDQQPGQRNILCKAYIFIPKQH